MARVRELFTFPIDNRSLKWEPIIKKQLCRYSGKRCFKVRKSQANISIGTCIVQYGKDNSDIIICPNCLLERNQIFADCLHLLTLHQPGNELHIVPEVAIPGGNVDFFLVSTDEHRHVRDFVGIELQAMDTTGSIWAARQSALYQLGISRKAPIKESIPFGINWKMTAKTILVQLHHKIQTFEALNKHLVLVVQDHLLNYIMSEFKSDHLNPQSVITDAMHFHSYKLNDDGDALKLVLNSRYSTNSSGISKLLGLNADAEIAFDTIAKSLETKISDDTVFTFAH